MKALNDLILKNTTTTAAITTTAKNEKGEFVITVITPEIVSHPIVSLERNKITRNLDVCAVARKEDKGQLYYGIRIDEDGGNLLDTIDFLGNDVVSGMLNTTINTKMQTFNETAFENVAKTNGGTDKVTFELFKSELINMVASWSMREITKKQLGEEMASLGKELATASAERKVAIMTRLTEIALAYAS